jgi:hypothetical protein
MPSPFPGMDPFLEHPAFFPGVHDSYIVYLSEALQGLLPAPYFAEITERRWIDSRDEGIGPDAVDEPRLAQRGVSVPTDVAQPILITVPLEERRETYLEIRSPVENGERVVTTIEVLSITNKTPGPKGRALYLQKQREVLDSDSNLVEIDLQRGGTHTTGVPLERLRRKAPPFDYHVCVHAFEQFGTFAVYTIQLSQPLPRVVLPLLPGDGTVSVDLQAVFQRSYDTGPYRRRVRYEPGRIVPGLRPDQLEWATKVLRDQGLLPGSPATPPG